jgi:hypothetical protein
MVNRQAVGISGIVLLALLSAFVIPTMVSSATTEQSIQLELEETDTEEVTSGLSLTLETLGQSQATVTLRDNETSQTQNITINEGATENYTLPGGSGSITANELTPQTGTFTTTYSPTYGWNPAGKTIISNIGLILSLMVFVVIVGGIKVVL